MRDVNISDGRAVNNNNTLDTINAAATAIAIASSDNNHDPAPPHVQKKRWGSWLSITRCFGYHKNRKRIGHAVLVPETTPSGAESSAAGSSTQEPTITLPFIVPPSSPASFLQSEPPSVAQSPAGMLYLTSVSASMFSPGGPASIFAIGPYAHETQLVSPPVFSTFTTEPSTAPFTPPAESVQLTTPSSPEVPFAQLLDPNSRNGETCQRFQMSHYDFHTYQLHPGSPVGQLISPRSAFSASGASSPLPDCDSGSDPPKVPQGGFIPSHWVPGIKMSQRQKSNHVNEISVGVNHKVLFELSAQEVLKCVEDKAAAWNKALKEFEIDAAEGDTEENLKEKSHSDNKFLVTEIPNYMPQKDNDDGDASRVHPKDPSLPHTSGKEFNFDNADEGDCNVPNVVPDWWANEKVAGIGGSSNDWSFFPVIQPGIIN